VIYEVNKTPAVSIAALRAVLDATKSGDTLVLHIQRGTKLKYIAIDLE
jgi:S1-C subfamily serine protease